MKVGAGELHTLNQCELPPPAGPGFAGATPPPLPRPLHFPCRRSSPELNPSSWTLCPPLLPAGEPILVKSRDLPLHWFDKLFRTLGSALLFALWALRAGAARLLRWDRQAALVFVPAAIYAVQAVLRLIIYQLHVAGGWWVLPWGLELLLGQRGCVHRS